MRSNQIRRAFIDYFRSVGHEEVASAPLPQKDNPTLLFNNAGMNQFAKVFLGQEKRPYSRAVTSQKCMRVSGKHNDLTSVGPSPRHHTFFEMLGNFSFGDYFKKEAIQYAWEFLTEVMELDKSRLWVSVYTDDDEAEELWQAHIAPERILRFGKKENFWEMGDVGPCGPCSEIHYYLGDMADMKAEGVNVEDDYLEIWNLVFMQYEKAADGSLTPLPRPSIDTGMGLERITQVKQGFTNNYDTDLFTPAMDVVQELLRHSDEERRANYVGYRVIADHVRAATFVIADGVRPGNDGAEYVLRMVIRRAARFGRDMGFSQPFMAHVAGAYIQHMGEAYPELIAQMEHIKRTLTQEEERFARTLDNALVQLERVLEETADKRIPGNVAFDLYATHGLPLEITRDLAEERGFTVDEAGYVVAKAEHALASGSGAFKGYELGGNIYSQIAQDLISEGKLPAEGVSQAQYGSPRLESTVIGLLRNGERTDAAKMGDEVEVITAVTPFYLEAGGQVSDVGVITALASGGQMQVVEMAKPVAGLIVHRGRLVQGALKLGDKVILRVDDERRSDIRRNHTATHILHEELRRKLGKHVTQAGSLVAPDRLRFDFTHDAAVGKPQLAEITAAVNAAISANYPLVITEMGQKEAIAQGAMALFGEKYGDVVRTVKIGAGDKPYSFELCGGLHVRETADIQRFILTSESAVSAGVRRIEALTGRAAQAYVQERLAVLDSLASKLNCPPAELEGRLDALLAEQKRLQKEVESLRQQNLIGQFEAMLEQTTQVRDVNLLVAQLAGADPDSLRVLADKFRERFPTQGAAVLATVKDDKPLIIAVVTKDLHGRGLSAGNLVREVAQAVGGGGGGRPDLAQAGGKDATKLPEALAAVLGLVDAALK